MPFRIKISVVRKLEKIIVRPIIKGKFGNFVPQFPHLNRKVREIMATSEKTVLLETILAQHKEKTKKNYMPLKLKAADLKKFGFAKATPAPSAKALDEAIRPYLGENLMLKEKDGVLCLAQKMTPEEWARLIVEEKTAFLHHLLSQHKAKEKKSYMPLKLKAAELKEFGLAAKPAPGAAELEKALAPFRGSELILLKKKPARGKDILYLAYKLPHEEYVRESLQTQKKAFTLKTIAGDVPITLADCISVFNRMLHAGQLLVTKIDDKFNITGVQLASARTSTTSPITDQDDCHLFRAAFEKLDRGRIFVRICNMRRELGWSEERFNAVLRKLRADGTIQLHAGDVSTLTEEDVHLSYTDENNLFYATLTWK